MGCLNWNKIKLRKHNRMKKLTIISFNKRHQIWKIRLICLIRAKMNKKT